MWIIAEWQYISPEVTVKGFTKCCISNAMDETYEMLWNAGEVDGNDMSACEEDEGSDCEDGESNNGW